jgi:hypothetical protein
MGQQQPWHTHVRTYYACSTIELPDLVHGIFHSISMEKNGNGMEWKWNFPSWKASLEITPKQKYNAIDVR